MAQLTKEQSRQLLELLKENPKMRSKEAFERLGVTPTQLANFKYIHSKEIHEKTEEETQAERLWKR